MVPVRSREVEVDVDYGQFYLCRSGAAWASDRVTTNGYERHLWTNGSFVYVGTTKKFGPMPVRVDVLDHPAADPERSWQHVVEVSLDEGRELEIYNWGDNDPVATIDIGPGPVRLRVSWRGLVAGLFEGMDEHGNSTEELLVQVWPAPPTAAAVLRCWEGRALPEPTDTSPQGLRQIEGYEAMLPVLADMETRARLAHPYPQMPGGGEGSSVVSVLSNPDDGSWWVDGYDVRRTLREVNHEDAMRLLAAPHHHP